MALYIALYIALYKPCGMDMHVCVSVFVLWYCLGCVDMSVSLLLLLCMWFPLHLLHRLVGPVVKASAPRVADLGSIPAFSLGIFRVESYR